MTAYTVNTGDVGKHEIAVAANTEDTVTFGGGSGDTQIVDAKEVEVTQLGGTKPVYFCFGTTAATVRGAHCYHVPTNAARTVEPPTPGDTVVRLICEAAAVVSVIAG